MKTKAPSLLLPAAAILSTVSSLGASAATPADAAAATIGRSSAGAALQDLEASAARPHAPEPAPVQNVPKLEEPSTGFRFDPPVTKPALSLSEEERARLNEIGTDLVGFVHAQERIAEDRDAILEKKLETGKKQLDAAEDRYSQARIEHRDALADLRDAERDRDDAAREAERAVANRDALREALDAARDANRQRSEETEVWMEKLKAEKARVSEAQEAQDEAAGRLQAEKSAQSEIERQLAENVKALVSATNEVARKAAAVVDRRKAFDEAVAEGAKAVDDRRKEAADKAGAADAARAEFRRAKDDEAEKAGAKEAARRDRDAAQKSLSRANRGVEAAREAVAVAESDRDAAARRLEEARRKDAETKGWFSRLFIPSVERAERRTNAAERAVADAKGRAVSAEKDARDAALALGARDKAFSAADAAWKKAVGVSEDRRKDWDGALAEQSAAEGRIEEAKAAAKADRRDAERQVGEAERAESAARKDARRARGAVEENEDALAGKMKDVGRAEKVVRDRSERTEAAEAQRRAVENEKGMGINLLTERELDEKLGEAVHDVLAKKETKSEREIEAEKARQEVARTQAGEEKAREAFATALAYNASAEQTSGDEARENEKARQGKISASEKSFWDKYRKTQVRDAPDLVKKNPKVLEGELETARADRIKAVGAKTDAEAARDRARADLAAAEERARTSRDARAKTQRAVEDADRALAKAQGRADDAQAALDKARAAQAGAKDPARAADAVQAASDTLDAAKKAVKDASDGKKAGLEALQAADKEAKDAQTAAGEAAKALKDAETGVSEKSRDLAAAEKKVRAREDALKAVEDERAGMSSKVDRAVDDMRNEFWRQVEAARRAELEKIRRASWSDSQKRHQEALDARRAYKDAKSALARAKRDYDRVCAEEQAKGLASWRTSIPVQAARVPYKKAREAFKKAEIKYNSYYSDGNTFKTAPLSDDEAIRVIEGAEARLRDEYNASVRFDGDRLWLARTSVNDVSLLDSFFDEMAWQADESSGSTEDYAKAAAAYTRDRAIYGGFYFAGLDVETEPVLDPATGEEKGRTLVVFADKGRFGPSNVLFVDKDGKTIVDTNDVAVVDGEAFRRSDVIGRFVSRDSATNELERQAFNFVEFRQNFNALNADPDIKKADVVFRVAPSTFEYDYDSGLTNYPARVPRAIQAEIKVEEDPNWWNLLMPRPLSPLHGVFAIDNFNSMGETDRPLGEADTWMARATFQWQHRLLGRDAALTVNPNVSLGGSLQGVAGSWFLARPEDRGWSDGGWRDWAFTLHGGYTKVDQGDVIPSLDILGTGYYGGLQGTTRIFDSIDQALDLSLGLTYRYVESSVRIEGQEIKLGPNGGDGYVIVPASAALMWSQKNLDDFLGFLGDGGRTFATLEGVYNLGGSSADELAAFRPAIDDERYLLLRAQLARIQLLGSDSSSWWVPRMAFLRGEVQWASAPVIGAEQFGLGGHGTVRGYAERLFMGDTGASATLEFRTPINVWSIFTRVPDNPYRASERFQLVYFVDVGYFMLEEGTTNDQGVREDDSEFIASVGVGLRYSLDNLALRFDLGVPLVRDDDKFETSGAAGHASLQWQF